MTTSSTRTEPSKPSNGLAITGAALSVPRSILESGSLLRAYPLNRPQTPPTRPALRPKRQRLRYASKPRHTRTCDQSIFKLARPPLQRKRRLINLLLVLNHQRLSPERSSLGKCPERAALCGGYILRDSAPKASRRAVSSTWMRYNTANVGGMKKTAKHAHVRV